MKTFNVLIVCTGNSARSILGEAVFNHHGGGKFVAYSAGSKPAGQPNPYAIALLQREGIDTAFARSKSWDEFSLSNAPQMDFVITVCDNAAAEECPYWPRTADHAPVMAHWGLPDPASVEGSDAEKALAFADTYRALLRRVQAFAALPIATLDALTMKKELSQIGQTE